MGATGPAGASNFMMGSARNLSLTTILGGLVGTYGILPLSGLNDTPNSVTVLSRCLRLMSPQYSLRMRMEDRSKEQETNRG